MTDQSRLADLMGTVLQYICDTALVSDGVHMALLASLRLSKIYGVVGSHCFWTKLLIADSRSATKIFAPPGIRDGSNQCIQNLTLELLEERQRGKFHCGDVPNQR